MMATFSAAGSSMSFPQSGSFRDAASMNQQLYRNIQAAHANRISQTGAAQQQLQAGYSGLSNAVLRRLAGSNRANIQDINDKYTALSGSVQAQLIARGLGNTSILGDLYRGVASDRSREVTRSRGEFAQLMAKQQSQIGLAGLGAQGQGIGLMSGLLGDQISSMERVSAPYPSEDPYAMRGGMPGPSATPSYMGGVPQGLFAPSSGIDFGGGGGGGMGDPSFYAQAAGNGYFGGYQPPGSALPGYEMGASGYGPYVPPGSYPQVEATGYYGGKGEYGG